VRASRTQSRSGRPGHPRAMADDCRVAASVHRGLRWFEFACGFPPAPPDGQSPAEPRPRGRLETRAANPCFCVGITRSTSAMMSRLDDPGGRWPAATRFFVAQALEKVQRSLQPARQRLAESGLLGGVHSYTATGSARRPADIRSGRDPFVARRRCPGTLQTGTRNFQSGCRRRAGPITT